MWMGIDHIAQHLWKPTQNRHIKGPYQSSSMWIPACNTHAAYKHGCLLHSAIYKLNKNWWFYNSWSWCMTLKSNNKNFSSFTRFGCGFLLESPAYWSTVSSSKKLGTRMLAESPTSVRERRGLDGITCCWVNVPSSQTTFITEMLTSR